MGAKYQQLTDKHIEFIKRQQIFFVATATKDSYINLSPKDCANLYLEHPKRLAWLNLTGSGNETAAHLMHESRITMMFCSFEQAPGILRIYGNAQLIYPDEEKWQDYIDRFSPQIGARQIIIVDINLVAQSCGFGVPMYQFIGLREDLKRWSEEKGEAGLKDYRQRKNTLSLNNQPIEIKS